MNADENLQALFTELYHLDHLSAIANWDEAAMMPTGGGQARANALSTLRGITHNMLTAPQVGEWIATAKQLPLHNTWQQRNLYWIERQYRIATCLPLNLVKSLTKHEKRCEQAWRVYRSKNDWKSFLPELTELFNLVKTAAEHRADALNMAPYDAMIDEFSPGFTQAKIDPIFQQLRDTLPTLITQISEKQSHRKITQPKGPFPINQQRDIGLKLMAAIGFDFQHGRLDVSNHPFCGGVPEDVRLTTRYNTDEFISALMGICHETGHACYEQHLPEAWITQPVGRALGMTVHESQSLFIEMQICRSREFATYLVPHLVDTFGQQDAFTVDNIDGINTTVTPDLIRVDADEVTYPLHVILRYEIERDLFAGKISIQDLADIWDEKMRDYLGISTQGNDKDGVMQDVHWPCGAFGYFPAYTLGRLVAAQLYHTMMQQQPDCMTSVEQGDFSNIMRWLNTHIHSKGSLLTTDALLTDATGETLNPHYFIEHVKTRFL